MVEDNTKKEERRKRQEEQAKKSDAYMLALGKFVSMFSQVEMNLQTTFWIIAGVPQPTAQAVFSGVRVDGCMQFIGRIADAQKWEKAKKEPDLTRSLPCRYYSRGQESAKSSI